MECEYGAEVYSNHDRCVTDVENKQDHRNQSSNEDEEEPLLETVVVSGIRSDHLRLLCDEEGNVIGPNGEIVFQVAALARIPVPVSVDQSTGINSHNPVSISVYISPNHFDLSFNHSLSLRLSTYFSLPLFLSLSSNFSLSLFLFLITSQVIVPGRLFLSIRLMKRKKHFIKKKKRYDLENLLGIKL